MKKILKIILSLLLIVAGIIETFGQSSNLIQNGDFEHSTCPSGINIPTGQIFGDFYDPCLANSGWYSYVGSPELWYQNTCYPSPDNGSCTNHYAAMLAASQYSQREGIFYDKNLTLSPDTIYTLSLAVKTNQQISTDATVVLTNSAVDNVYTDYWNLPSGPVQTLFLGNITNIVPGGQHVASTYPWKYISVDFIPNNTYHQLALYLGNGGDWYVDDVSIVAKQPYTGQVSNGVCCGAAVSYSNTILPVSVINKTSITSGTGVTANATQNTVLSAAVQISFEPGTSLTATVTNSIDAFIAACVQSVVPLSSGDYGAGPNIPIWICHTTVQATIGGTQLQSGVTYSWSASPAAALTHLTNTKSLQTTAAGVPANTTYTLTATNGCGSSSSSMTFYNAEPECSSRIADFSDSETTKDYVLSDNVFSCYPNPSQGYFTIAISDDLLNSTLLITDVNGKTISQLNLSEAENKLDLTNQTPGVYFVTLISNKYSTKEKLVIF